MSAIPIRPRRRRWSQRTLCILASLAWTLAPGFGPASAADPETGTASPPEKGREVAVIKTDMGTIVFEFLPDVAPKMVDNFKDLARSGFYDGTTFHRVIPGFMIQGGDPLSKDDDPSNDGTGSGPRKMPAEFTDKYSHKRGIVSTARSRDPNSGSCQFFIVHRDSPHLDRQYTIFGRVVEGMKTVDRIADVKTDCTGKPRGTRCAHRPLDNVVMESVTIETR
ncbi:MAG: peptidylprolyl isomerase [Acidobacteriota bacterium]